MLKLLNICHVLLSAISINAQWCVFSKLLWNSIELKVYYVLISRLFSTVGKFPLLFCRLSNRNYFVTKYCKFEAWHCIQTFSHNNVDFSLLWGNFAPKKINFRACNWTILSLTRYLTFLNCSKNKNCHTEFFQAFLAMLFDF